MKIIPLTQGKVAIVDDGDFESLNRHKWYFLQDPDNPVVGYAMRNVRTAIGRTLIAMHRVILGIEDSRQGDHKDGNGLNNSRSNLRIATRTQNQINRRTFKNNRLGVKGVSATLNGKFVARLYINRKAFYLGVFNELNEAKAAREQAASRIHSDFVRQ